MHISITISTAYAQNPQTHKASVSDVLTCRRKELRCPRQMAKVKNKTNSKNKQTKKIPEAALRCMEILFWFYSNYGSEEM